MHEAKKDLLCKFMFSINIKSKIDKGKLRNDNTLKNECNNRVAINFN